MWWEIIPEIRDEFRDWHSHEHFRERLRIPGFLRATRWSAVNDSEGVFQMYEMESYDVHTSDAYLGHLNSPTPWSTRMMPHHRNMVRSQCRVLESSGAYVASHLFAIRLSPEQGGDDRLRASIKTVIDGLTDKPGCVGAHLLQHETPQIAQTTEQKIRGGDRFADWVLLVSGYDVKALEAMATGELSAGSLVLIGAQPGAIAGIYELSYSATPSDIR